MVEYMSYLVIARKWRPRNFSEVIGQQHVTRTLGSAITHDRIAHAYIFSGPRGVGKTSIARILAKSLNCKSGPTTNPCGECSSCVQVQDGNNFDVIEIDGASNNSVNDVRELRNNVKYGPSEFRWKVYIIDEVHMLSTSAFNALLKTLEEPPPQTVFIFATTELHKLPLTVLSRCQRFDFKRLKPVEIEQSLGKICEAESRNIEDRTLRLIARRADGGMRDAQSLLDQVLSFSEADIKHDEVIQALGLVDQERVCELLDLILKRDAAGVFSLARTINSAGADMSEYLLQLAETIRNLLLIRLDIEAAEEELAEEQLESLKPFASGFSESDLLRLLSFLGIQLGEFKRSTNQRLHFELCLLRMVNLADSLEVGDLIRTLSGMPPESLGKMKPAFDSSRNDVIPDNSENSSKKKSLIKA
jgi:DNA polymerase III subunit gamma/tau